MHIYLVIALLGNVVFTLGPWDVAMNDDMTKGMMACIAKRNEMARQVPDRLTDYSDLVDQKVTEEDFLVTCRRITEKPKMGSAFR